MSDWQEIFEAKRREIEASGLCQWNYNWPKPTGCVWCDKGHAPIQSSVSDKMVHTGMRTVDDRVVCTRRAPSAHEVGEEGEQR